MRNRLNPAAGAGAFHLALISFNCGCFCDHLVPGCWTPVGVHDLGWRAGAHFPTDVDYQVIVV